jgi:hypothetical protein
MNKGKNKKQIFRVGDTFDNFIVVEECRTNQIKCLCKLTGQVIEIDAENLTDEKQKRILPKKSRIAELNEQSQQLTVTSNEIKHGKYGEILIRVRCSCGTHKYVKNFDFVSGNIASCGCLKRLRVQEAKITHGLYKSKEYKTWLRLKTICFNENNPSFKQYGGVGIKMYVQWIDSFQTFYDDMGPCSKDAVIARIDPSKGFFPYNCCWLSRSEYRRVKTLIKCGINPKLLIQPKITRLAAHSNDAIPKGIVAAIRKEHASGESNITVLSQKYNITTNEVVSILIYDP